MIVHNKRLKAMFQTDGHVRSHKLPFLGVVTHIEMMSLVIGLMIGFSWYFTRNWVLNDIMGLAVCFVFLKTLRLNKLIPGLLLLTLLFFYDIFWVFGSTQFTKG